MPDSILADLKPPHRNLPEDAFSHFRRCDFTRCHWQEPPFSGWSAHYHIEGDTVRVTSLHRYDPSQIFGVRWGARYFFEVEEQLNPKRMRRNSENPLSPGRAEVGSIILFTSSTIRSRVSSRVACSMLSCVVALSVKGTKGVQGVKECPSSRRCR